MADTELLVTEDVDSAVLDSETVDATVLETDVVISEVFDSETVDATVLETVVVEAVVEETDTLKVVVEMEESVVLIGVQQQRFPKVIEEFRMITPGYRD